jgi:hypothetical protein
LESALLVPWKKPHRRSAGDLARSADLSSGAMTNRLDQLEEGDLSGACAIRTTGAEFSSS